MGFIEETKTWRTRTNVRTSIMNAVLVCFVWVGSRLRVSFVQFKFRIDAVNCAARKWWEFISDNETNGSWASHVAIEIDGTWVHFVGIWNKGMIANRHQIHWYFLQRHFRSSPLRPQPHQNRWNCNFSIQFETRQKSVMHAKNITFFCWATDSFWTSFWKWKTTTENCRDVHTNEFRKFINRIDTTSS